jgi:flagellar hook-associated protein 3 FlgL
MVALTAQSMATEIRRQQTLSQSIADLQAQVSGGKKLTSPSQDPQAWVQVSEIGRQQAQQTAWQTNINYGNARAQKAEANLSQINTLFSRAHELMVTASSSTLDPAGKAAVVAELQGIRQSTQEFLNEKDYQGVAVFDDTTSTLVPVSRGVNLDVVGTRQSISEGINVNGTAMTLDDILVQAIAAVQSPLPSDRSLSLTALGNGLDHVILAQSQQGIRGDRLANAGTSLTDVSQGLAERRSKLEDTDLTTAISLIQAQLLSLEAAQSAFARINRQTLFDLIG